MKPEIVHINRNPSWDVSKCVYIVKPLNQVKYSYLALPHGENIQYPFFWVSEVYRYIHRAHRIILYGTPKRLLPSDHTLGYVSASLPHPSSLPSPQPQFDPHYPSGLLSW